MCTSGRRNRCVDSRCATIHSPISGGCVAASRQPALCAGARARFPHENHEQVLWRGLPRFCHCERCKLCFSFRCVVELVEFWRSGARTRKRWQRLCALSSRVDASRVLVVHSCMLQARVAKWIGRRAHHLLGNSRFSMQKSILLNQNGSSTHVTVSTVSTTRSRNKRGRLHVKSSKLSQNVAKTNPSPIDARNSSARRQRPCWATKSAQLSVQQDSAQRASSTARSKHDRCQQARQSVRTDRPARRARRRPLRPH